MGIVDFVIMGIIGLILGGAGWYIWKAKKKGIQCVGCPDAETCASRGCSGDCGCCGGRCSGKKS